jgi:hypothetical protein
MRGVAAGRQAFAPKAFSRNGSRTPSTVKQRRSRLAMREAFRAARIPTRATIAEDDIACFQFASDVECARVVLQLSIMGQNIPPVQRRA